MYVWCKLEPDVNVRLWFVDVKSEMLPFAMLLLSVITAGDVFSDLIGIAVGHLFFFIRHVMPETHGKHFLKTPMWLEKLVRGVEEGRPNFITNSVSWVKRMLGLTGQRVGG